MRGFYILAIALLCIISALSPKPTFAQTNSFNDLGDFFDKRIHEMIEQEHIPNLTVAVVSSGKVVFEKGYGYADLEKEKSVDPKTSLFRIGSVSKLFTWTAIMQLVEKGELDLYTDINEYIDFEIPNEIVTQKNNTAVVEPITLHHLLTHTAGFEDYANSIFRLSKEEMPPLHEYVQTYLPKRIYPVGEVLAYSNYATALAGYIVEKKTGVPFETYIEQNIFQPLGMEKSTFNQPVDEKLTVQLALPYRFINDKYVQAKFEYMPAPAGGMSSSATDMAQFMLAYLQGGKGLLAESTVQQMLSPQFTHHATLDGMTYGFMERNRNGIRALYHGGSTMLYDTGLYLLPEEEIGIFISYSGANYQVHVNIFEQFVDYYFPNDEKERLTENSNEDNQNLAGEYHQNRRSVTTSGKFISLTSGVLRVEMGKDNDLFVSHLGKKSRFTKDSSGIYYHTYETKVTDPYGEFSAIVFEKDPLGRMMLMTDGPMTYSKAPWYSTSGFTILLLGLSILYIISSFIYRGIIAIIKFIKRKDELLTSPERIIRIVTTLYGIITIVFVGQMILTGQLDPLYGLPKDVYKALSALEMMIGYLPLIMTSLLFVLVPITIILWWKKRFRLRTRIHYSLYTFFTICLGWLFYFWNIV